MGERNDRRKPNAREKEKKSSNARYKRRRRGMKRAPRYAPQAAGSLTKKPLNLPNVNPSKHICARPDPNSGEDIGGYILPCFSTVKTRARDLGNPENLTYRILNTRSLFSKKDPCVGNLKRRINKRFPTTTEYAHVCWSRWSFQGPVAVRGYGLFAQSTKALRISAKSADFSRGGYKK
jgi:hypothetical protein